MNSQNAECGMRNAEYQTRSFRIPNSEFRIADQYLVGGVNSPVRAYRHLGGEPVMLARSRGAQVWDVDGTPFMDFIMGWGALPLGHNPPEVIRALRERMTQGVLLGLTHPAEAELARLISEAVPSVEQVRFTISGTEACMTAVRLARASTTRDKILVMDGCYHGHSDALMAGTTAGIPASTASHVIRVPYNDAAALTRAVSTHGRKLACAIIEPVAANMGVVPPQPGYLALLRQLTKERGILLIFDEVVTGFRVAHGGAQARFGVTPDLTVFGKIIGGGLPIGALGGPRSLMQRLTPEGNVYHGGTFAGHPLSMAAGIATLRSLRAHPPYDELERRSARLADGLQDAARRAEVAVTVNRVGSMLTVFFEQRKRFAHWARALQRESVLIPPSPCEAWFVSTAHTPRHIDRTVRAARRAFAASSIRHHG